MRTITVWKRWSGGGGTAWGRLARRDVWLIRQTRWKVIARDGDTETGKVLRWEFETEPEAMLMMDRLLRADTAGQWREQEAAAPPPAAATDTSSAPARPARRGGTERNNT